MTGRRWRGNVPAEGEHPSGCQTASGGTCPSASEEHELILQTGRRGKAPFGGGDARRSWTQPDLTNPSFSRFTRTVPSENQNLSRDFQKQSGLKPHEHLEKSPNQEKNRARQNQRPTGPVILRMTGQKLNKPETAKLLNLKKLDSSAAKHLIDFSNLFDL